jgi:hypothetical protein
MKGWFWNGDGFGDLAKHYFVRETIREHKLDFFAILETGRSSFSGPFLIIFQEDLILLGTAYLHKGNRGAS